MAFINKHHIISESQFGFRENRSTENATSYAVNKLVHALDQNKFSIGVFLDLLKAFDTINHDMLLYKLEHYGVRGITVEWLKSYLSNRQQFASFNSVNSLKQSICGVPQGSVSGPLLFIIYINNICNTSDIISFCLFADDTSLVYRNSNVDAAVQTFNVELVNISNWLLANKLCINSLKSNDIIFCSKHQNYTQSSPLVLNGTNLNKVTSNTFLGIHIYENLTWKGHINKNVGIMNCLVLYTK